MIIEVDKMYLKSFDSPIKFRLTNKKQQAKVFKKVTFEMLRILNEMMLNYDSVRIIEE